MTNCKFKIGETYKDRKGGEWVLVARNDEYKRPLVFRHKNTGGTILRCIDGRIVSDRENRVDVLPNKRTEWVITYDYFDSRSGHWRDGHKVLSVARSADGLVAIMKSKPEVYKHVRGPMLWEYEE